MQLSGVMGLRRLVRGQMPNEIRQKKRDLAGFVIAVALAIAMAIGANSALFGGWMNSPVSALPLSHALSIRQMSFANSIETWRAVFSEEKEKEVQNETVISPSADYFSFKSTNRDAKSKALLPRDSISH